MEADGAGGMRYYRYRHVSALAMMLRIEYETCRRAPLPHYRRAASPLSLSV